MVGSPWESSNVLVPAARPKMPRRDYEFHPGRLRRAYEFSPSASGELRNSTRTCLDAGSVFSLHVRAHTRAHTQLSTVWQSPHAACSSMQQRAHDLCPCVHAPESCCRLSARKLLQTASEFGQPLPRWGYGFCCTRAPRACDCHQQGCHGELMCAICICRDEMMSSPRKTTTCWRLLPTQKCRDEIMSSTGHGCGEIMSFRRQVPVASF